jgi:phosphate starvation-inducible PhoH-like protein
MIYHPSSNQLDDQCLTKAERRLLRKKAKQAKIEKRLLADTPILTKITPRTKAQEEVFTSFYKDRNLILHGCAGTGKTFIALYLALDSVLTGDSPKPIVIIRSVVPTRDIGFLPGSDKQKSEVYEAPYNGICHELVENKHQAYHWLKAHNYIQFSITSFLRGLTFRDNIIIIDECQNMSDHEINTIMTRVGEGCRVIFCGDFTQKDYTREGSGMPNLLSIAKNMKSFDVVKFDKNDIVRSGFVRDYLMTRIDLEERGVLV